MSETKFTPGPWRVVPLTRTYGIYEMDGTSIAKVDGAFGVPAERRAANAALIAAAPDMYAALEYLEHAARAVDVGYLDGAVERARAALARARGEA